MFALVRRSSMILRFWSPATWRTSSPGSIPVRSSATFCATVRSWMTLICCDRSLWREGLKRKAFWVFVFDIPGACAFWPVSGLAYSCLMKFIDVHPVIDSIHREYSNATGSQIYNHLFHGRGRASLTILTVNRLAAISPTWSSL